MAESADGHSLNRSHDGVMMLISIPIAMITIAVIVFFYFVVRYRSPGEANVFIWI